MIKDMDDLKRKMKEDADEFSDALYTKGFLIYHDGITDVQLSHLHEILPGLPESYIACLQGYNIFDVAVGYFDLTPVSGGATNIVDSLVKAQSEEESFLPRAILDPLGLYWIGNNNNDTIYVAGKNSPYEEGEIVAIHEFIFDAQEKDYENYRLLLAKDFEQFLIIAGNLNEVHRLNLDSDLAKVEMLQRLKALNVDEKYHDGWMEYL